MWFLLGHRLSRLSPSCNEYMGRRRRYLGTWLRRAWGRYWGNTYDLNSWLLPMLGQVSSVGVPGTDGQKDVKTHT